MGEWDTVGQWVSGRVGVWESAGVRACRLASVGEVRQVGPRVGGNNGADLAATHALCTNYVCVKSACIEWEYALLIAVSAVAGIHMQSTACA